MCHRVGDKQTFCQCLIGIVQNSDTKPNNVKISHRIHISSCMTHVNNICQVEGSDEQSPDYHPEF